jgi:hypothetical protein
MAEIAGTIFGVISLSIQLIEKFSKYTNSVKDAITKAEHIRGELDRLVDLLEHLESMISKLDPTTPAALTKVNIQECAPRHRRDQGESRRGLSNSKLTRLLDWS